MSQLWPPRTNSSRLPGAMLVKLNTKKENLMQQLKRFLTFVAAMCVLVPSNLLASSHREAPISALDHSADVTDWYAFVSYDHPDRVTMILNVDGFLEPSNGPNYFPFDPNVLYEMKIDNNQDGVEDVVFQFQFKTTIRQPSLFKGGKRYDLTAGQKLIAVPSNVGPLTMPNYPALMAQGIYDLGNNVRVFA